MHDFLLLIFRLLQDGLVLAVAAALACCMGVGGVYALHRKTTGGARPFPWGKAVVAVALVGYGAVVCSVTLLRGAGGFPELNVHLFRAWREAWNQFSLQTWLNVVLNIALFVPLGILLPLLAHPFRRWYVTIPVGFAASLALETGQYLTGGGLSDVDDLFTNTLGCCLGYCLVMLLGAVVGKGPHKLGYATPLVATALLFAVIFGSYHLKTYGNLAQAPSYRGDVSGITWNLATSLEEEASPAWVYRTQALDKTSCETFGANFAQQVGVTFPDTSYYDNSTYFANHSTGDFLSVNYHDRSYTYTHAGDHGNRNPPQVDQATLRQLLEQWGIFLPQQTQFTQDGNGVHTFTVDFVAQGNQVLDGTVTCRCVEGPALYKVEYNLVTLTPYAQEEVLSPALAYAQMVAGNFAQVAYFENWAPEQVEVTACTLDYQVDSKGFYQPVYLFTVEAQGQPFGEVLIPALA